MLIITLNLRFAVSVCLQVTDRLRNLVPSPLHEDYLVFFLYVDIQSDKFNVWTPGSGSAWPPSFQLFSSSSLLAQCSL